MTSTTLGFVIVATALNSNAISTVHVRSMSGQFLWQRQVGLLVLGSV